MQSSKPINIVNLFRFFEHIIVLDLKSLLSLVLCCRPEFLDCTARTGLDMLSKHYDQATSAWVVFFAPESDADIGYYNEFMQYLGEKQRAAVAKLDDRTTLFLVPPSEFSEKVLKVPGKVSISGVVLRLDQPSSNFGSSHQQHERNDTRSLSFTGDQPFSKLLTPSVPPFTSLPDSSKSGVGNISSLGNFSSASPASFSGSSHGVGNGYESYNENRHEYPLHKESPRLGPNWSSHHLQNSVSVTRNRPTQVSNNAVDPVLQEHPSVMQRAVQDAIPTGGMPRIQNSNLSLQDTQTSISLPTPLAALQPEQLAQLASLLGQQRQPGSIPNPSTGEDFRHRNAVNETENLPRTYQKFAQQNNQMNSEPSTSQFGQAQELQQPQQQQVSHVPRMVQRDLQSGGQGNQQLQSINTNEAGETDRMQATLQLAAALLQQIQQGKGS